MQVWQRKGFTRLTLEWLSSKFKRVGLVFPLTINVGCSFAVATVVALVEAAVIERVIRRVGGKGSTCASFDVEGKGSTCASFDVEGTLLLELADVERSLVEVTFLLSSLFESFIVSSKSLGVVTSFSLLKSSFSSLSLSSFVSLKPTFPPA